MPTVPTPHDHALPVETLTEKEARLEAERPPAPWPYSLNDPVRAVHFALEPDCPYSNPATCPYELRAANAVRAYKTWAAAHPHATS
ncbi:hypothetical protein ACFWIB_15400 [Streptomyces sp. NPDC127051]|uniref:hypothetical protein n=1 Tax=Streptomyces sp. NPDC127051 TaxID=3347119 RepID=UPI003669D812